MTTITVPSGDPDKAGVYYSIPVSVPKGWRGEVRSWFDYLPPQYHPRLRDGLESAIKTGMTRGENETAIVARYPAVLRGIHRTAKYDDDMHRRCINEYIAFADKRVKTASATDRAERPLPLPRCFKDWRGFAAFLRRTAAPFAAHIAAVPDDDDELFCDVARDAQSEFERAVRDQCAGMQRHDLNRLLAALGVVESWADAPATPPEPPKPVATTATKPSRAGAKPVAPVPSPGLKSESGSRIAYRRASEIQAKPVNWLWHGRIARGKVSMLAGNPGLGKSQITASMAATVTTGGTWPVDRARCERGNVVFLSAEDDAEDTIRPRLEAAGADLARVYILDAVVDGYRADGSEAQRGFNLKTDLTRLGKMLDEIGGAALIVIDPITAYLGETDSHKNAEIRALLSPLSDLAAKHGAAVVCVSHLNKSAGGEALMRVTGSLAFVAAARAAFIVAKDNDDPARRLFLPLKNNIGNDQSGLSFAIEPAQVRSPAGLIETSRIAWGAEAVTVTADEAVTINNSEEQSDMQDAKLFLRSLLSDGPVPSKAIRADAEGAGFSWRTIQRAQKALGIEAVKDGMKGGWTWKLP